MKLTKEQLEIINSSGDIKINAVAGSGKTTTVIEYAKAKPPTMRILYLAFNKSVKLEAQKKFRDEGLNNVQVETAHSLAYRHIVFKHGYKVTASGYKPSEIVDILNLKNFQGKHTEYVIANHILKFISFFCNSKAAKVQDLNYLDIISDPKAIGFVGQYYKTIEKQTRIFLAKMDKGEIEITHDFYLKKFQLSTPTLPFDCILFDEGQDASGAMLDIFLQQKAIKVIVGDTHQQIYGWRYAINSLEKVDFKDYYLSASFRFKQDIADLGMKVLGWKEDYLGLGHPVKIYGLGKSKHKRSKAILARTNLGLLIKAIDYTETEDVDHIYFEGNIHSYTYADQGTSLYDVLNLHNGNKHLIRDKLIQRMNGIEDLEEYIEKTEEVQLGMMIEIVKKYGNEIPAIIEELKEMHVPNDEKDKAEIIFSTVHRCKGMEYDEVHLVNDFISEEKLEKIKNMNNRDAISLIGLNEEINILYVAITRAKNKLYIPSELLPESVKASESIIITNEAKVELSNNQTKKELPFKPIPEYLNKKKNPDNAHTAWTDDEDDTLTEMFCDGFSIQEMAEELGRSQSAIRFRIKKLDLWDTYGHYQF